MTGPAPAPPLRSRAFLFLYAVASAGGVVAWLPLFSLLLPMRIEAVAGDARIGLATLVAVAGAVVASVANIAAGWASDRSLERGGGRRRWVAAGLVALALAYPVLAAAATPATILAAVLLIQVAVNLLIAPLLAILADEVPEGQIGLASSLLALGAPLASAFLALLVAAPGLDMAARLMIVPLVAALLVGPLLLVRAPARLPPPADHPGSPPRDLAAAWLARLLVQIAGVVVSLYLFYYLRGVAGAASAERVAARTGQLLTIVNLLAVPAALAAGRLSDRTGRRRAILFGAAGIAAAGLVAMGTAAHWLTGAIGYAVFAIGSAVFVALHAGFAMLLLPSARRRGRDLGLLNLTNTAPSIIGPPIAWALTGPEGFGPAFLALAALTLAGGALMLAVRGD
ncbi:MFS transporter [Sphingomonas spermidinifaciens]|uniref:MFS transporter n=1 Tax=Sphingomonas spermidinifaciens TaxID=1141889 RepID=A0A2A4B853_9SPHN|nr:MFS transporter [Sphingomonas spermidinifaciens]PCD03969.1 MFS transporter [Sphingomonas spermidinifaciens]